MRSQGADIIFAAAGGSGAGLVRSIKENPCLRASELPTGVKFVQNQYARLLKGTDYQSKCKGDTRPRFFIGVDNNQNYQGDFDGKLTTLNHGLTSVVKEVDNAVYILAMRGLTGHHVQGELSLGLKEKAVDLAVDGYNKALLNQSQLAQLELSRQNIADGRLKVPNK